MLYQLSYSRLDSRTKLVEGEGFEPSKAFAGRFTVCSHWPLGHPSIMSSSLKLLFLMEQQNSFVTAKKMELAMGLEPATSCLQGRCSTIELRQPKMTCVTYCQDA